MTTEGTIATFWSRPCTRLGTSAGSNTPTRAEAPISFRSGAIPAVGDPRLAPPRRQRLPAARAAPGPDLCGCRGRVGAMSRHRRVPRRQPSGAAGGSAPSAAVRSRAEALRDVGVDEAVEMAVHLALERFQSGDEAGERPGGQAGGVGRALAEGQGGEPAPVAGPGSGLLSTGSHG